MSPEQATAFFRAARSEGVQQMTVTVDGSQLSFILGPDPRRAENVDPDTIRKQEERAMFGASPAGPPPDLRRLRGK